PEPSDQTRSRRAASAWYSGLLEGVMGMGVAQGQYNAQPREESHSYVDLLVIVECRVFGYQGVYSRAGSISPLAQSVNRILATRMGHLRDVQIQLRLRVWTNT